MKTPSTWEELPASLREDAEKFWAAVYLTDTQKRALKTLVQIAFHEGAVFGIEQDRKRFKV